jgi:transcription initiation factor TFIID subunit 9B
MASPAAPLTPPAEPSSAQTLPPTQTQSSSNQQSSTQPSGPASNRLEALLSQPATSLTDNGTSKRPRDHRLIHLLLASHGVNAYQERVPLQLMDFAYRYTSSILGDALHIQNEGYDQADNATQGRAGGRGAAARTAAAQRAEEGDVSMNALRMSIASRISHQFQGRGLPKEFLKQLAEDRNRISLTAQAKDDKAGPGVTINGLKLPYERYCLTGQGWGLKEEWDSEGEESVEDTVDAAPAPEGQDVNMDDEMGEGGDEEGIGNMEDVFGADDTGNGDKDGDEDMEDS